LRWRGGTVHSLPIMVLVLLQLETAGSHIVVTMVVFVEVGCHTWFSEGNQVHDYMHARIKFHAYSDI
jgi:hypothetical protein